MPAPSLLFTTACVRLAGLSHWSEKKAQASPVNAAACLPWCGAPLWEASQKGGACCLCSEGAQEWRPSGSVTVAPVCLFLPAHCSINPSFLPVWSLSFGRFWLEHAHTEHAQPSLDMPTDFARISEWKGFVHIFILHHRGDSGYGSLPAPDPPHSPTHSARLQTPERASQHRQAPGPLHGADLLLPAHQPAMSLCTCVPPLVQPGLGPAPLEDYPSHWRDHQCGPCPESTDPQALPGHPQCVSHAGDCHCQWLPAAHRPGALYHCTVLSRTEAPGSLRMLQYLERGCLWCGVTLSQPGASGCVR